MATGPPVSASQRGTTPHPGVAACGKRFSFPALALVVASLGLALGGLWWSCRYDPRVPFLPSPPRGQWILFPKPPDTRRHAATVLVSQFQHSFTISSPPTQALLSVQALRNGVIEINGQSIRDLDLNTKNWKRIKTVDVRQLLRLGSNVLSATVSNALGPPALCCFLDLGNTAIESGPDWQVSLAGAGWQKAGTAANTPAIRPGNPLFGAESIGQSLGRVWPWLLALSSLPLVLLYCSHWLQRNRPTKPWSRFVRSPPGVLAGIALGWVVLFWNNLPQQAPLFGFDRDGHLEYIDFILQGRGWPLADQGWQMYQPPLFYALSAAVISPFAGNAWSDSVILGLRALCALVGLVHLGLVYLCLRELFPKQPSAQNVGLVLAAFLPANLYLSHHITNEGLAALFVTVALYFCLRASRAGKFSIALHFGVGIALGLALLSKFSALLAVPLILGALAWQTVSRSRAVQAKGPPAPTGAKIKNIGTPRVPLAVRVRDLGPALAIVLFSMLAVCGWHYGKVWQRFGTPLIGNWDSGLPFAWWQEPGYHTGAWLMRGGAALNRPLFSSTQSLADGVYSSLWGDGLCSGSARMDFRPPWNYDVMNAAYLIALPMVAVLALGALLALVRFVRAPSPDWFLVIGLLFAFAAGIIYMALRVPSYAQVKAFYGLPSLLPLCALAALASEFLTSRGKALRVATFLAVSFWATTAFASFWIRSGNPDRHRTYAITFADDKRFAEAVESFSEALRLDPLSLHARVGLADALDRLGRHQEATQETIKALEQHPNRAEALIQRAINLTVDGKYPEAVEHLSRAVRQAPDHPAAWLQLGTCLGWLKQAEPAVAAYKEALRIDPFNADAQFQLGMLLSDLHRPAEAAQHYQLSLLLEPQRVEALNNLAWILAASSEDRLRDGVAAVELAERACALTSRRQAVVLGTLAAAYARAGRFDQAVTAAEEAATVAAAAGQTAVAEKNQQLLQLYRSGKAYQEK